MTMTHSPAASRRRSIDVVQQLLDEMNRIVVDYHPSVGRTGSTVPELIQGTAMFPGGTGLWRGTEPFGEIPAFFPENPIMLVAHNFDSVRGHADSKRKGGEVKSLFWTILRGYIDYPEQCFFTNVFMGLQPESAVGKMPSIPGYEAQCLEFLRAQIEIVNPRIVVALGGDARRLVRRVIPNAPHLTHPSARTFIPLATRTELVGAQAATLRLLRDAAPLSA
jgi:hypothetical protein